MTKFQIILHGYDTPILMNVEARTREEAASEMMQWAEEKWQSIDLPYGVQILRTEAMTSFEVR